MAKEKPVDFYITRPTKFGNGAKLKAYKKHINKEMVVMSKEYFKKLKADAKASKFNDKEFDKNDKAWAKKQNKVDDDALDDELEMVKGLK